MPSTATLTASPDPATFVDSNQYETFDGTGFDPNVGGVQINVRSPEALSFQGGPVAADGTFSLSFNGFITTTGTYDVEAYQYPGHGPANHLALVASTSFEVVA